MVCLAHAQTRRDLETRHGSQVLHTTAGNYTPHNYVRANTGFVPLVGTIMPFTISTSHLPFRPAYSLLPLPLSTSFIKTHEISNVFAYNTKSCWAINQHCSQTIAILRLPTRHTDYVMSTSSPTLGSSNCVPVIAPTACTYCRMNVCTQPDSPSVTNQPTNPGAACQHSGRQQTNGRSSGRHYRPTRNSKASNFLFFCIRIRARSKFCSDDEVVCHAESLWTPSICRLTLSSFCVVRDRMKADRPGHLIPPPPPIPPCPKARHQ